MENKAYSSSLKHGPNEEVPPLAVKLASKPVSGFDNTECGSTVNCETPSTNNPSPREHLKSTVEPEFTSTQCQTNEGGVHPLVQLPAFSQSHAISITMPASPSEHHIEQAQKAVVGGDKAIAGPRNEQQNHPQFTTITIPEGTSYDKEPRDVKVCDSTQPRVSRSQKLNEKRYDSFKTWSGKLERQLLNLCGKQQKTEEEEACHSRYTGSVAAPAVSRYFDALEGPELDTLRAFEVLALPEDRKWPFLLRFPISSFGMCLGVGSQAILWKTLATAPSMRFLHVNLTVNFILWWITLASMCTVSIIYSLKAIFYFEAVRREYYHPVRVNFFFAPWIACLFLAIGVPPSVTEHLHGAIWYILMTPILCLELKIYGQWMSGGQRRLSKVANPSNHLSIVGNFVGALLGASMGLKEGPIFFFAVGLAHYSVLFVTLYQRLPTNETLPKELHPVFFLFVVPPSVACMAWANIRGDFDNVSRIAYFVALFLYVSLAVRINFFRGFRFSLAWWAYTVPMTAASVATIRYSNVANNMLTRILSMALSSISTFTLTALLIATLIHAFVLDDLFPNDIAIAITQKRPKWNKKRSFLKPILSGIKDLQVSVVKETPSN